MKIILKKIGAEMKGIISSSLGLSRYLFIALSITLLANCAGVQSFKEAKKLGSEGAFQKAIAKYEMAIEQDPTNIEYKLELAGFRASVVSRLLSKARFALQKGKLSDAEKIYREVQFFDPHNDVAEKGLEDAVKERKHRQSVIEAEGLYKEGSLHSLNAAALILRGVLIENPDQKQAIHLKSRIDESTAKLTSTKTKLSEAYSKPITLEFQDAPIKAVFDVISKVSGLNFFFDKDLRPDLKVSILVKNSSLDDAVRLLLVTNQLKQKILGDNSILIYPNTPQKLKDYQELTVRTFYLVNADVKAVSATLKTILKVQSMVTDERLGLIVIRDTPEVIRAAEKLVTLQDVADSEVMLEVEVLEIKRARLLELGVQWPSQLSLAPLSAGGTPLTLEDLRNIDSSTTQATIGSITVNARKEDQDSNILANPRIRVKNKEKAKILIGDRVPVITTTSTSTGFVSESISYVDVGLKLEVEPTIYLDEDVAIKIDLEVSTIVREIVSPTGSLTYQIGTRGASTILRLKDGETQVLAGLISHEDRSTANKVPFLGELPLIGRLFKSQKDDTQRSEILLSITPRIIRSIKRPDLAMAEFESGTDTYVGAKALRLRVVPTKDDEKADSAQEAPTAGVANDVSKTQSESEVNSSVADVRTQPIGTFSNMTFSWESPAEVKVGEQFSAVLNVNSPNAISSLPILIGFDPQLMQLVNVQEGDFLKQNNGLTKFTQRSDTQGKVFASIVRQSNSASDTGTNGIGKVLTVTFKALKPTDKNGSKLQLLSVGSNSDVPVKLPVEKFLLIVP